MTYNVFGGTVKLALSVVDNVELKMWRRLLYSALTASVTICGTDFPAIAFNAARKESASAAAAARRRMWRC